MHITLFDTLNSIVLWLLIRGTAEKDEIGNSYGETLRARNRCE